MVLGNSGYPGFSAFDLDKGLNRPATMDADRIKSGTIMLNPQYPGLSRVKLLDICLFIAAAAIFFRQIYFISSNDEMLAVISLCENWSYLGLLIAITTKSFDRRQAFGLGVLLAIALLVFTNSGMSVLVRATVVGVAVFGREFKQIILPIVYAVGTAMLVAAISGLAGFSPDNGRAGICFGFVHQNQAGQCACLLILLWLSSKTKVLHLEHAFLLLGAGLAVWCGTQSKTAAITILASIVIMGLPTVFKCMRGSILKGVYSFSFPFLLIVTVVLSFNLSSQSLSLDLDELLTNRLFLSRYAFDSFGIGLFGHNVDLHDKGVWNAFRNIGNVSTTVDSTYCLTLIQLGVIATILISLLMVVTTFRAWQRGNYVVAGAAVCISMMAFTESQFTDIFHLFVLLYLVSSENILHGARSSQKTTPKIGDAKPPEKMFTQILT